MLEYADLVEIKLYTGDGATGTGVGKLAAGLERDSRIALECLDGERIRQGRLETADAVIFPGGSGSGQAAGLGEAGKEMLLEYVGGGGNFIGICAGGYLASRNNTGALGLSPVEIVDLEHWRRGELLLPVELTAAGAAFFGVRKRLWQMHFANGPIVAPASGRDAGQLEVLARFRGETLENGALPGLQLGSPAIWRNQFGRGRVLIFSAHPEHCAETAGWPVIAALRLCGRAQKRKSRLP